MDLDRTRGHGPRRAGHSSYEFVGRSRTLVRVLSIEQDVAAQADAKGAVTSWSALRPEAVRAVKRTLDEIEKAGGGWTFAKLTIANAALRELAGA